LVSSRKLAAFLVDLLFSFLWTICVICECLSLRSYFMPFLKIIPIETKMSGAALKTFFHDRLNECPSPRFEKFHKA
jgi:hypothetical protein